MKAGEVREAVRTLLKRQAGERRVIETELEQARQSQDKLAILVVDTLEFLDTLAAPDDENDATRLREMLQVLTAGCWQRLAAAGVLADGAQGEAFEPARHHVVERVSEESLPEESVARVDQRGIVCTGRRLRRAKVTLNEKGNQ